MYRFKFEKQYFVLAVLILITEILIALYMRDRIIRPYGGDFLIVIFLYCLVKSFVVIDVVTCALVVLLFSYMIETLQFFRLVEVLGLSESNIAKVVLGTSFEWTDLVAYTAGVLFVLTVELKTRKVKIV